MLELVLGSLFGVGLPPVVSFLKGSNWPTAAKLALTIALCLIAGAASAAIDGTIDLDGDIVGDPEGLLAAAGAAFTSATVIYKTFFQSTALNARLEG